MNHCGDEVVQRRVRLHSLQVLQFPHNIPKTCMWGEVESLHFPCVWLWIFVSSNSATALKMFLTRNSVQCACFSRRMHLHIWNVTCSSKLSHCRLHQALLWGQFILNKNVFILCAVFKETSQRRLLPPVKYAASDRCILQGFWRHSHQYSLLITTLRLNCALLALLLGVGGAISHSMDNRLKIWFYFTLNQHILLWSFLF